MKGIFGQERINPAFFLSLIQNAGALLYLFYPGQDPFHLDEKDDIFQSV